MLSERVEQSKRRRTRADALIEPPDYIYGALPGLAMPEDDSGQQAAEDGFGRLGSWFDPVAALAPPSASPCPAPIAPSTVPSSFIRGDSDARPSCSGVTWGHWGVW